MTPVIRAISAGITICLVAGQAEAAPENIPQLDRALAAAFKNAQIPGGAVAIVEHGTISFVKGYGVADTARKTPVTPDTVFRAGSISKSFTSIAVMTLVQQGKLSLNGRLADLAPDVKFVNPWERSDPVRLANLLEHSTGWPDVPLRMYAMDNHNCSIQCAVQDASANFRSQWKPGSFAVYNNVGPVVAGYILERASGQNFDDYMRAHVLRPMGMGTAEFEITPPLMARLAKSYGPNGSLTPYQYPVLRPAATLTTSVRELAQIVRLFLGRGTIDGRQILAPESVARIEHSETSLASRSGLTSGYGLGNTALMDTGETFRGHNGGIDSFTSVYGYSVRDQAGYVLLANGGDGVNFGTPISELIEGYLTHGTRPTFPPIAQTDDATLARYAGFYRSITPPNKFLVLFVEVLSGVTHVTADHGKLIIGGDTYVPTGAHTFRRVDRDQANMAFVEQDGAIYRLGSLSAQKKVSALWLVFVGAIVAVLAVSLLISIAMILIWIVAAIRRRFRVEKGLLMPIWPFASLLALAGTVALPIMLFATLGPGPALIAFASMNGTTVMMFVISLLFPIFALAGLASAFRSKNAWMFMRIYVATACTALLIASAYATTIGWVGIRTWAM